jgi:ubiquinone biosynthesis protein UbiJ
MASPQSPFSFLDGLFERVAAGPQPPQWLVNEVQQRVVLFLNHVLMQEPEATDRLVRQKGRIARVQWRAYSMALVITPAGLFNLAPQGAVPDLQLEVTDASPLSLAQVALRGDKPSIRIEGDVQLAADINWLVDHVRWDVEEDLARVIGDAPAHTVAQFAGRAAQALRKFVGARAASATGPDAWAHASESAPAPSSVAFPAPPVPSAPSTGPGRADA